MDAKPSTAPEFGAKPAVTHKRPFTLAIDIGGTFLKASVLDAAGQMVADRARIATPHPSPPEAVLAALAKIIAPLPAFDRISAGFPGVVRDGHILTGPNLGTEAWHGFPLAKALEEKFGKPARVLNDADVQGLGIIDLTGFEVVLTLGTGIGSSFFKNGKLLPHLELGQHPYRKGKTYDHYLGNAAFEEIGVAKWNKRLQRVLETVRVFTNFEKLFLGGGNAKNIKIKLPDDIVISDNIAGILGGVRLWDPNMTDFFEAPAAKVPATKAAVPKAAPAKKAALKPSPLPQPAPEPPKRKKS